MKKWEEKNKLKIHQKKIQNAKSTLPTKPIIGVKTPTNDSRPTSNSKSPQALIINNNNPRTSGYSSSPPRSDTANSIRSSSAGISDYFEHEKDDLNSIPLYKLLRFYGLQQYAKALISRNFGYDLSKLASLDKAQIDLLKMEIKLLPGHQTKFLGLLSQIREVCKQIEEETRGKMDHHHHHHHQHPQQQHQQQQQHADRFKKKNSMGKSTGLSKTSSNNNVLNTRNNSNKQLGMTKNTRNTISYEKKVQVPKNKKMKLERIGFDFFRDSESMDDDFTKTLEQIINKYQKELDTNGLSMIKHDRTLSMKNDSSSKKGDTSSTIGGVGIGGVGGGSHIKTDTSMNENLHNHYQKEIKPMSSGSIGVGGSGIKAMSEKANASVNVSVESKSNYQKEVKQVKEPEVKLAKNEVNNALPQKVDQSKPEDMKIELAGVIDSINSSQMQDLLSNYSYYEEELSKQSNEREKLSERLKSASSNKLNEKDKLNSTNSTFNDKNSSNQNKSDSKIKLDPEVKKGSNVVRLIEKKLDPNNLNQNTLNLEVNRIKELYNSFDGAKMTSTLINIDIEEMCYCLAKAIHKHIEFFLENILINDPENNKIESVNIVKKDERESTEIDQKSTGNIQELKLNMKASYNDEDFEREYKNDNTNNDDEEEADPTKRPTMLEEMDEPNYDPSRLENEDDCIKEEENEYTEEDDDQHQRYGSNTIGEEETKGDINYSDSQNQTGNTNPLASQSEYYRLDPFVRNSLAIISEKTHEGSEKDTRNTPPKFDQSNEVIKSNDQLVNTELQTNEEMELFLRESLRESILLNMKESDMYNTTMNKESITKQDRYQTSNISLIEGNMNSNTDRNKDGEKNAGEDEMMEFSYESRITMVDIDDKLDLNQQIKILFDRTYIDKGLDEYERKIRLRDSINVEIIANFCANIIITSKMEKEVIIICLIYIERLILKTSQHLSAINWRKITFTALILASKIWDDESFENDNFAKAFPVFTTREINELERVFLEFIEYNLVIQSSEYAKYYFILRAYAEKDKKSFPLRALDLNTVLMLQKNSSKIAYTLKQVYSQALNRTF